MTLRKLYRISDVGNHAIQELYSTWQPYLHDLDARKRYSTMPPTWQSCSNFTCTTAITMTRTSSVNRAHADYSARCAYVLLFGLSREFHSRAYHSTPIHRVQLLRPKGRRGHSALKSSDLIHLFFGLILLESARQDFEPPTARSRILTAPGR